MKKSLPHCLQKLSIVAALLAASQGASLAANISYVGLLTDSQEVVNWLKPSTPKTYDIDGDNKYGSYCAVHWTIAGTYSASTLSYAGSGGQYKQGEYPDINSLASATSGGPGSGPAALVNDTPINTDSSIALFNHTFTVNADLTGHTLRVGVNMDNLGAVESANTVNRGVRIRQVTGSSTAATALAPVPDANVVADMVFFDIQDATTGDQFIIENIMHVGGVQLITPHIGCVAWDTNLTANVSTAPTISRLSSSTTVVTNGGYVLGVLAGGAPSVSYQWLKAGAPINGATGPTHELHNLTATASYAVAVTSGGTTITSAPVTVTVASSATPSRPRDYRTAATALPGLVGYYSFENGTLASASTNNGTVRGAAVVGVKSGSGLGGGLDQAAILGADGGIELGAQPSFEFRDPVSFTDTPGTVAAWIRVSWAPENSNTGNRYFAACDDFALGMGRRWAIGVVQARNAIRIHNGDAGVNVTVPTFDTNWHHVVVTFTPDGLGGYTNNVYVDGLFRGGATLNLGSGFMISTRLGSLDSIGNNSWVGGLDEVGIYTNALADSQVLDLYNATFKSELPQITGQPQGDNLLAGLPFSMSVVAQGPDLHYYWRQSAAAVGTDSAALNFASVALADAGTYVCVVSNFVGAVTSAPAVLQVSTAVSAPVAAYQAAVAAEPSLISRYKFDDQTANDSAGVNHGTTMGTTAFMRGLGGGPDRGLSLGSGGDVALGAVPDFEFSDDNTGTVELWIQCGWTTSPGYAPCVLANRDGGPVRYSLHMQPDKVRLGLWTGSYTEFTLPANAGTNWHHVLNVFSNGTWAVYWDGQYLGSRNNNLGASGLTTQIGGSSSGSVTEGWVGGLDEVAFYRDPLTAAAAQAHYAAFASGTPPVITVNPQSVNVVLGDDLLLQSAASGAGLSYLWLKGGMPISGATDTLLSITGATAADSGSYQMVASNAGGAVTSAVAQVTVAAVNITGYRGAVEAEPSLISFYPLDTNADDSVSTNHGTLIGPPLFGPGLGGPSYGSITLDGAIAFVTFGSVPAFDMLDGTGTFEAWVRAEWDPATMPYNPAIAANEDTQRYFRIRMTAAKTGIQMDSANVGAQTVPYAGTNWHHLAVVFDSAFYSLYWDGQPVVTNVFSPLYSIPPQPTQLGSILPTGSDIWLGRLDEVAFYADALSAAKISSHVAAAFGTEVPRLTITRSGSNVVISWSTSESGWALQKAGQLSGASWDTVATSSPATLPIAGTQGYFRLHKP
jgi:hypothetical protein